MTSPFCGRQAAAHGFWPLIVGRFVCGVACGICISACMIYISETTCPRIRGVMLLLPETFATGGLLMCYVLGLLLHWRYVAIVCGALPNLIIFAGFWWLPESPTWLVHQFRLEDAAKALRFFRGVTFDAESQVQELVIGMEKTKMTAWQAFRLLRYAEYLRPTIIVIVQMTILNFSGFNAMFGYAVVIFRLANTGINEYHCAILLAGVRLASVIVSWSLIDRLGRRVLLSVSGAVCALSLTTIGGFFYARVYSPEAAEQMAWLPLAGMLCFICSFAVGTGPVSWVVFAELLPSAVRELCGSITIIIWALTQFVILQMFPALRDVLNNHGIFWLFAGVCLFQLVFAVFMVPETRRRTLEDIHREHFSVKERKSMQESKPDGAESDVKSQVSSCDYSNF